MKPIKEYTTEELLKAKIELMNVVIQALDAQNKIAQIDKELKDREANPASNSPAETPKE